MNGPANGNALSVVEAYFRRDAEAPPLFSDDFIFAVAGAGSWPIGGSYTMQQFGVLWKFIGRRFPDGIALDVIRMSAGEDRVAVEATSRGMRRDGVPYANDYMFIFDVRDGRIAKISEFCDIILARRILSAPLPDDIEADHRFTDRP